jgi:lambda family phage portal protein
MDNTVRKQEIFDRAVGFMSSQLGGSAASHAHAPVLYDSQNRPLMPSAAYGYRRQAAKREGSMKNWIPQRLFGKQAEARQRHDIVARSIDLANNDPHAAGVVESFSTAVVGAGLTPRPQLDPKLLGFDKDVCRKIQHAQWKAYQRWSPRADAGERMNFGAIQFLQERCMVTYGEHLTLAHMIDAPDRPYYLACQVINPLRLKTPLDLAMKGNIRDGIELGEYGQPVAYWIKRSNSGQPSRTVSDVAANFVRIPARAAHRWRVIHRFVNEDPEQVRGMPMFARAMKFFRDINDYLDAELVSNIVTAAFALWIEVEGSPFDVAGNMATGQETVFNSFGNSEQRRYQEWEPGQVLYGEKGEKPHTINANRPGQTFDPFTKLIKKSMAYALGMPYAVLFKDPEGLNFSGFRSALLDAWRVYSMRRTWLGRDTCQPIYTMLMEEAFLRGELPVDNFYSLMPELTRCDWQGAPKGDIEPIQAIKADILEIQHKLKTRRQAAAERARDWDAVIEGLDEEEEEIKDRGMASTTAGTVGTNTAIKTPKAEEPEVDEA